MKKMNETQVFIPNYKNFLIVRCFYSGTWYCALQVKIQRRNFYRTAAYYHAFIS